VPPLTALDYELGPDLERAIRDSVERGEAFCVLDQRLSPRRRQEELAALGATRIRDRHGTTALDGGEDVDERIGLVMLTSGSSGPAKAAELTWDALRASAAMTQAALRGTSPPVWFPCLPPNHIGGLAVILRAVLADGSLVWGDPNDLDAAPSHGATHVALVRAQLARHDLSAFEAVLVGGGHAPKERPANVIATWGMTETGSGIVYDGHPLAGVDVASVDGELLVRSPTLFRSYRSSPKPLAAGPDGARDWFPTGDAGDVVDGRVSVRGRMGFVINTGGEKLWPEDLESALRTLPGVRDVAVTSVEDPEWGARVIALVVGDGGQLDSAIRATAEERVGPWAKPREIRYVAAIPRTGNGKIRRDALAHLH
jgi:o-succinylbenzoate---CoA ligase